MNHRTCLIFAISTTLVAGLISALTGCATTDGSASSALTTAGANAPLIRTAAAVATGAVLDFAVSQPSTRTRDANEMYSAASAIYSLTNGQVPTPAQVSSTIIAFGGSETDASYAQFVNSISSLYASYYSQLVQGDAASVATILNAIAGGIEDATQSYVSTPAPSN